MDLGLAELISSGKRPGEAASLLTTLATEPEVLQMLVMLAQTSEGRELLEEGRQVWAYYGLRAPWTELIAERACHVE